MGIPKALAVLDGQTFLRRILNTCAASCHLESPVVVIGAQAQAVRETHADLSHLSVRWIENPTWSTSDMVASVRLGLRALGDTHALIWPVDCPRVPVAVIAALAAANTGKAACIPVYEGRRGHPVVLSAALCRVLLEDAQIESLRVLLGRAADKGEVLEVEVGSGEVLENLNHPWV